MVRDEQNPAAHHRASDPEMITRLANVLYWTGYVLALIWLAVWLHAISVYPYSDRELALAVAFGGAAVIWMIGRAIRYVWIGR